MFRLMNMLNRYNEDKDREGSPVIPFLILESSKSKAGLREQALQITKYHQHKR